MGISQEVIDKILDISRPSPESIDGHTYFHRSMIEARPEKLPLPAALELRTLSGIKEALAAQLTDKDAPGKYLVHIAGPSTVHVISELFGFHRQREVIASATPVIKPFAFDQAMSVEAFVIAAQAQFVPTEDMKKVLAIVGNIVDENVKTTSDDGISQTVATRVGITRLETTPVPNPVTLAPFRTFPEIAQPESKFILRMRTGIKNGELPTITLVEADGGAWRGVAMAAIGKWLTENLPSGTRVIG